MKKTILIALSLATAGITLLVSCNESVAHKEIVATISKDSLVKRGAYLVNAIGCDDCHSPKQVGPNGPEVIEELRFSGFRSDGTTPEVNINEIKKGWAMFSPDFTSTTGEWGQSYAANITSDETGIGNWSEDQFMKAIREGKYKGMDNTRPLLPPMPWFMYRNFSDDDLKAIFAFLQTTKPVRNVVPAPKTLADLSK
jgi:hypothetical protein